MKTDNHNPGRSHFSFTQRTLRTALLGGALLMANIGRVHSQTYTLSNAWSIATGTFNITGGTDGGNRGLAYSAVSNVVFVPYRAGSFNFGIYAYDGTTGALLGTTNGALGSLGLNCDQVGVADDGVLYGCPLAVTTTTSAPFKVYSWTNWANNSNYLCYSSTNGADPIFTYTGAKRIGDTMAVTGSGTNTLILAGVGGINSWVLLSTTDGTNFTSTLLTNSSITGLSGVNVYGLSFYTNNTFLVKPQGNASASCFIIQFPTNFASLPSPVATTLVGTGTLPVGASAAEFISYSPAGKLFGVVTNKSAQNTGALLYAASNFPATAPLLASTNFSSANANGNLTAGVALGGPTKTNWLYALDSNNGLQAYRINFTTAAVAPSITTQPVAAPNPAFAPQTLTVGASGTAPLAYLWESNTTNSTVGATPVPGATNSALLLATPVTNYYFAVVTNTAGAATSSVVLVSTIQPTTNSVVSPILNIASGNTNYPFLANDDNTRGLGYDPMLQRLVVANKAGGAHLFLLDASTGANLGSLNTAGMYAGGTFPVDQVVVADDGVVYAANLALTGSSQFFNLTSWSSATTNATAVTAYGPADPGSGSGERWGDTMTVRGSGANTQLALGSRNSTNFVLLTTSDGVNFSATLIPVPGVPNGFAGLGIAFGAGNTIWAKNYGGDLYEVSFDPSLTNPSAVLLDYVTPAQVPSPMVGLGVDSVHSILGGVQLNDQNPDLQLFQLTGNANSPALFDQAFFPVYNPSANGNKLGVVDMKYPRVYAMDVDIGIIGMTYGVPASTAPSINKQPVGGTVYAGSGPFTFSVGVSGTLPLFYQWQKNSVSNAATATNIPGATAGSFTLNPPQTSDTAWYDVVVTNFGGSITSTPVLLTVVPPTTNTVVTNVWTLAAGSRPYLDINSYASRGLAYDTNTATVLVCDSVHTTINVLNAADGSDSSITINTAGLPSGTFTLDQIGVADDGVLYGGNLVLPGDGFAFAITQWTSVSSGAGENASFTGDPGNGSGDRWGDTMAIRGSGANTQILLGSYGHGNGPGTNVALLTTTDGTTFTAQTIPVAGTPAGFASLGIAFGAGNTFWAKGDNGFNLRQVAFDPTGATPASVIQLYTAGTQTPNTFTGLGVDVANNLLFGTSFDDSPNDFQMYQLTGTTNAPVLFNQTFYSANNVNSQHNAAAAVKFPRAFGLDVNNGLVALAYGVPPPLVLPYGITAAYTNGVGLVLTWPTVSGRNYQLQSRAALATGSWGNVGAAISGSGSPVSYTNNTLSGLALFYRVVAQ